jgi:hypothetical protein
MRHTYSHRLYSQQDHDNNPRCYSQQKESFFFLPLSLVSRLAHLHFPLGRSIRLITQKIAEVMPTAKVSAPSI